jgi:hypothetical protein
MNFINNITCVSVGNNPLSRSVCLVKVNGENPQLKSVSNLGKWKNPQEKSGLYRPLEKPEV